MKDSNVVVTKQRSGVIMDVVYITITAVCDPGKQLIRDVLKIHL